jgi:hypothetical protein
LADAKIKLKNFRREILNNQVELKAEADGYTQLPIIDEVSLAMINENYLLIKKEIGEIIEGEIEKMLNTVGQDMFAKASQIEYFV